MSDLPDYIDRAAVLTEGELHRLGLSPEAIDIVQALQFQLSEARGRGGQLERILRFFDMLSREIRGYEITLKKSCGVNLGGLSKSCAMMFSALLAAAPRGMNKSQIHASLYDREPQSDEKIVDVLICKLRSPLRLIDIEIVTLWGEGYYIEASTAKRFYNLLDEFENSRSFPVLNWAAAADHLANARTFARRNANGEVSPNKHKNLIIELAQSGLSVPQIMASVHRQTGEQLNRLSLSGEICRWRKAGENIPYFSKRPHICGGAAS